MTSAKRPNILLFFTDMQRADTIQALGNPHIKTPNLDRLVKEGTAFTSCYSPSPVCVPARCCLQYGLYPQKTGLFTNGLMMEDNGKSLPAILGDNGYKTHAIGKCHFTPKGEALRGFGSREIQEEGQSRLDFDDYARWLDDNGYDRFEAHGTRGEMYYIPQNSTLPQDAHPTNWIGDRSLDFIEQNSGDGQPWMLFSSFIHPHPPFAPPKPWHKLYRAPLMPLPNVPQDSESLHTYINRHQNRYKYRDQGIDNNLMRNMKAYYYATISFVDYQIGRILDKLEELGELDNTVILFTSDHGEYLGDYNCFGKRSMHDASSKIPMLVRYPERFRAGEQCDTPVSLVDVLPTLTGAAGIEVNEDEYCGVDFSALVSGENDREFVYSQHGSQEKGIYMILCKKWKYFYSAADDREFFFDRIGDPAETRNMAGMCLLNSEKEYMKQKLLEYLKSENAVDAYEDVDGKLDWKQYPRFDENYLNDPDSGLLIQDDAEYIVKIPGYTD